MYIRNSQFHGYAQGLGLGPAAAVELGAAALSFGQALFTGGSFQTQSSVVNYIHPNTPLDQKFVRCKRQFKLTATKPNPYFTVKVLKAKDIGEKFWFELSYEYNGNDLRNVAVEPLVNKSSSLIKSEFKIAFTGNSYSPEREPIAEIVFRISGTWKVWDPVPLMETLVSFSGNLYVRADGSARIADFSCEKDLVWYGGLTNSCPVRVPYIPPVPVTKTFQLPILFPYAKHSVSEKDIKRIHEWVAKWPSSVREKVARGDVTVTIEGFASKPGGVMYNLNLSERRAEGVKKILKKFVGSNAKFDLRSQGALSSNRPGALDLRGWLQRSFNPKQYDQAAVIRLEFVE